MRHCNFRELGIIAQTSFKGLPLGNHFPAQNYCAGSTFSAGGRGLAPLEDVRLEINDSCFSGIPFVDFPTCNGRECDKDKRGFRQVDVFLPESDMQEGIQAQWCLSANPADFCWGFD